MSGDPFRFLHLWSRLIYGHASFMVTSHLWSRLIYGRASFMVMPLFSVGSVLEKEERVPAKSLSRSKRTCVKVREGITKLQEMLDTSGGPIPKGMQKGSGAVRGLGTGGTYHTYSNPYVGKKRSHASQFPGRRSRRQSEG